MAKNLFRWSQWSPHLSNAITIVLGVPALSALFAGTWTYLSPSREMAAALVTLSVFMMVLWCCIGILWLRDRSEQAELQAQAPVVDAKYGLIVDAINFTRNPDDPNAECLVGVVFRNVLEFPIKMEVYEERLELENRTPDLKFSNERFPAIIHRKTVTRNFPPYGKRSLPDSERITGTLYFKAKYGHPDGNYSRVATRSYNITLIRPQSPFGPLPSFKTPFFMSPTEQERDEPYVP